jgi:hypothetical protein
MKRDIEMCALVECLVAVQRSRFVAVSPWCAAIRCHGCVIADAAYPSRFREAIGRTGLCFAPTVRQ